MVAGLSLGNTVGGPSGKPPEAADFLESGLHLDGGAFCRFVFHFVSAPVEHTADRVADRAAARVPALCPRLDWIVVQRGRARDLRRRRPSYFRRPRGRGHLADATRGSLAIALSVARFGLLHGDLRLRRRDGAAGIRLLDGGRRALHRVLRVPLYRRSGARIQRLHAGETASSHRANRAFCCRRFPRGHPHALGDHIQKGAPPVADLQTRVGTFAARDAVERGDSAKSRDRLVNTRPPPADSWPRFARWPRTMRCGRVS